MSQEIKTKLFEEKIVKSIARRAIIEALLKNITFKDVDIFIDQNIDSIIKKILET